MATYGTLTVPVEDIIGTDYDPRRTAVYIETNTPNSLLVVDGSTIRIGGRREKIGSNGTVDFANLVISGTADNPTMHAYRVSIIYTPVGSREKLVWTSSDFTFTATANLADISEAFDGLAIAPTWQSEFRAEMELISGLTGEDAAIANRINTVGSDTEIALTAAVGKQLSVFTPETYGAVGDGVTNDSAAWQAMFDAVAVAGSGRVNCREGATYLMADVEINGVQDIVIDGHNSTIKSKATPTRATMLFGHTTPVGRVLFENFTFDDNAAGRPAEDKQMLAYRQWDLLTIRRSSFTNCVFHYISNYGAGVGGRIILEDNTFDGATTAFTGSHLYCSGSTVEWTIRGCTFSNSGQPDPNGAQQGIYLSSSKTFVMSDCSFTNCAKAFDVRTGAKGVFINNILIVGGPAGAATSGTSEFMCYYSEDAAIQNVTILNSRKPVVVRVEEGARNILRNITYRAGVDSPAGQYGFRLGGVDHRIVDPDFMLPAGDAASAVFRMDDKPTNVEILGGSVEGGARLFLLDGTQATVAARVRNLGTKGHTEVWSKVSGGGSGSTPTIQLAFQGSTEWRTYTPTLGNFTGTTNYARFTVTGGTIKVQVSITVTAVTGTMTITLPWGPRLTGHPSGGALAMGTVVATDVSAGTSQAGVVAYVSSSARLLFGSSIATTTAPFTWASSDTISLEMEYEMG